jgi:hypothetical protein
MVDKGFTVAVDRLELGNHPAAIATEPKQVANASLGEGAFGVGAAGIVVWEHGWAWLTIVAPS